MQKPSIGRIVIYIPTEEHAKAYNAEPQAALVTKALPNSDKHQVNLRVFWDSSAVSWDTDSSCDSVCPQVPYSEAKEPGTWHWPERV